ncbi:dof zinc finger protein DOF5.6 [Lactuca sativa]|uniref:Dof zinc finger protein n=1 Tax=Lactuca sativa TaxID=4236 RepID=A0A9R1WD83_LACSA|nr:dof zinc finger protein DOF5.6 [Lactuca sativa]KAJ0221609.1 hypothetical protein LSAT_V11C200081540 [Lactuca sativa]
MMEELFTAPQPNVPTNSQILKPSPPAPPSSATNTPNSSENHHLRCPRCDSSNTKFCYYNNYNLTQPRYFCKTCRRYWTKGGALRNVPIGGGCRKNKGTTIAAALANHNISNTSKLKAVLSSELGKTGFMNGFQHSDPIFWASLPQTSHLLPLLRPTQNPNPNFALNPVTHTNTFSSSWRNSQTEQNQREENGGIINTGNNLNLGRMYQRLRSFPSNYSYHHDNQTPPVMNTLSSSVMESPPAVSNGEPGLWNPTLPWSDLLLTNAAYR